MTAKRGRKTRQLRAFRARINQEEMGRSHADAKTHMREGDCSYCVEVMRL